MQHYIWSIQKRLYPIFRKQVYKKIKKLSLKCITNILQNILLVIVVTVILDKIQLLYLNYEKTYNDINTCIRGRF